MEYFSYNSYKSYKTVKKESSAEFAEKKSVFICSVKSVSDEKSALDFINKIKIKYKDASHNVYAYIIRENNITRFSDDGEPASTAGMPILNVLQKLGLNNICAVVTRYFGGILLGAGGLVRAYSHAAKLGVESAGIAEFENFIEFDIACSYSDYEKILKFIKSEKIILDNTRFEEKIIIYLAVKHDNFEKICNKILNLTNGRADINKVGERFCFFE